MQCSFIHLPEIKIPSFKSNIKKYTLKGDQRTFIAILSIPLQLKQVVTSTIYLLITQTASLVLSCPIPKPDRQSISITLICLSIHWWLKGMGFGFVFLNSEAKSLLCHWYRITGSIGTFLGSKEELQIIWNFTRKVSTFQLERIILEASTGLHSFHRRYASKFPGWKPPAFV